jgi:hypothetical protein
MNMGIKLNNQLPKHTVEKHGPYALYMFTAQQIPALRSF